MNAVRCIAVFFFALAPLASAQLPVSGRPVPVLSYLDTIMEGFMSDPGRTIGAGVLGVSRGGRVIFLHAYGELTPGTNLSETALMRQASVVKPITAAAIQTLVQSGYYGPANLQRRAFNLSGNGGLLNIAPPSAPDANAQNITLGHLLDHVGGWDRNQSWPGDIPILRVRDVGIAMNEPDAFPTRQQVVDWAMQFALNFPPGAATYTPPTPAGSPATTPGVGATYSNFGYLVLGEVIDSTVIGGYLAYLEANILSAQNWIPRTEWDAAVSFDATNNPREPDYISGETFVLSPFNYTTIEFLPRQYGGWPVEIMLAHGGLIASSQAMLRFGNLYSVAYVTQGAGATQSNAIGTRLSAANPMLTAAHTGSLPGTSTILQQLAYGPGAADDVVVHVAFNERSGGAADWAAEVCAQVVNYLNVVNAAGTWPTETCDGFWVTLGAEDFFAGNGGYHANLRGFNSAVARVADGSYVRLRPGSQPWSGTISKRMRLDAPEGPVTIGQ